MHTFLYLFHVYTFMYLLLIYISKHFYFMTLIQTKVLMINILLYR